MMTHLAVALALIAAQPEHDRNAVYVGIRAEGLDVDGTVVRLPEPTFADGQPADDQQAALRRVAGSDRAAAELLRDSVTAPFRLTLRDIAADDATIRAGELVFVLRADLDAIDPDALSDATEGEPVEAGNMRFTARVLDADDLAGTPVDAPVEGERLVHSTGRLLDRIAVEATDRVVTSRTAESIVIAARTDPRFAGADRWPNRWMPIEGRGAGETTGPARPYVGGIGYAKITRLKDVPGAVVVELHFAFAEPRGWFDGAPILRSKFSLIAQDQIRRLRRELAERARGTATRR